MSEETGGACQSSIANECDGDLIHVPQSRDKLFLDAISRGLRAPQKSIPCKYLYDERGSQLFDQICELDEYYPTRTETAITQQNAEEIAQRLRAHDVLVEYGSGSSTKTRVLLDHFSGSHAYLPVDISEEHLHATADTLRDDYPNLDIHPIVADFTHGFDIPAPYNDQSICVYFPGSTIGNLERADASELLQQIAGQCGKDGGLLIGIDLVKSVDVLEAAYDDADGVTSAFNLNLLHRINRELDGDFDVEQFKHVAFYNSEQQRIEIYIESLIDQDVSIDDHSFHFEAGERIHTEYSHKYTLETFEELAHAAGLTITAAWKDARNYFALAYLQPQIGQ